MNSINDVVDLISRRDNISREEAFYAVDECVENIQWLVEHGAGYDEVASCLAQELGLEPDFLDIFLNY